MSTKVSDLYITICSAVGISAVLDNWNTIINLTLMIVSIINIVVIMIMRIVDAIKNKSTKGLEEMINQSINQIKKGDDENENK